eukprot:g899.t1
MTIHIRLTSEFPLESTLVQNNSSSSLLVPIRHWKGGLAGFWHKHIWPRQATVRPGQTCFLKNICAPLNWHSGYCRLLGLTELHNPYSQ